MTASCAYCDHPDMLHDGNFICSVSACPCGARCFECGHDKEDHSDGLDMCLFIKDPNATAVDDRFCSCSTFQVRAQPRLLPDGTSPDRPRDAGEPIRGTRSPQEPSR